MRTLTLTITALMLFSAGYIEGYNDAPSYKPPNQYERIVQLHSYMRDSITRWSWQQVYCADSKSYVPPMIVEKGE